MIPSTVVWCVTMLCQGVYWYIFSNLLYAPIAAIIIPFVLYMEYCTTHIQTFVGGPWGSLYQIRSQSYCWLLYKRQMLWQRLLCVRLEVNASHKTPLEINNWLQYRTFGDLERGRGNLKQFANGTRLHWFLGLLGTHLPSSVTNISLNDSRRK